MVFIYHVVKHHFGSLLVLPEIDRLATETLLLEECRHHAAVKEMAEGAVTEIVHQTCHRYVSNIVVAYLIFRCILGEALPFFSLLIKQELHLSLGKMSDPKTMRKTCMRSTGEHVVQCAQLVEVLEPREDRVVDVLPDVEGELDWLGVY